jgi:hypothetical protein
MVSCYAPTCTSRSSTAFSSYNSTSFAFDSVISFIYASYKVGLSSSTTSLNKGFSSTSSYYSSKTFVASSYSRFSTPSMFSFCYSMILSATSSLDNSSRGFYFYSF